MRDRHVAVVGAGIGGLCAAARLAAAGLRVSVFERAAAPGGKMRTVTLGGRAIDAGPTVLTLPDVFESLFDACGARFADHVTLTPQTVLARHAWPDGSRLDLFADPARSEDAVGRFAGAPAARGFRRFSRRARETYETLAEPFIRAAQPGSPLMLAARVGLFGLPRLAQIRPYTSLADAIAEDFDDPRLRQLFGRYATYCGSSPFQAPATLALIAHVEAMGVFVVEGGMAALAGALAGLAERAGASIRYGSAVDAVRVGGGRACGLALADGSTVEADAVVANGDVAALASGLLGAEAAGAVSRSELGAPSFSAVTTAFLGRFDGLEPGHHTVLFSADARAEFDELRRGRLPEHPTVYLCAQDRGDGRSPPADAPERGFTIVNAPPLGDGVTREESESCAIRATASMERCGLSVTLTERLTTGPRDFAALFPGTAGALYGQSSHGAEAAFRRPGARSRLPGLYLAGGSVHPGAGVPMAALSGRQAAESVLADLPSTRPSRPEATPGGTSTR